MTSALPVEWDKIRLAFTDMDGTIYKGTDNFPTTPQFIDKLREHVEHVYFLTNNSSKSHTDYRARLTSLGIEVEKEDILLSTDGLRAFLVDKGIKRVHLIGTRALDSCLSEHGIGTDSVHPEAIVLGFDTELTYAKLRKACLLLQNTDTLQKIIQAHSWLQVPDTKKMDLALLETQFMFQAFPILRWPEAIEIYAPGVNYDPVGRYSMYIP